jgi:ribonucleoside-triphosphate reductase
LNRQIHLHRYRITAQIIAQVASHIYGGTTINRIDEVLAPFVTRASTNTVKRPKSGRSRMPTAMPIRAPKKVLRRIPVAGYEVNAAPPTARRRLSPSVWPGTSWESRLIQQSILRNRISGLGKNRKTAVFPKLVFAIRDGLNHKFGDRTTTSNSWRWSAQASVCIRTS